MLIPRDLIAVPPISPDFGLCHPYYGQHIVPLDCLAVGNDELPQGANAVPYYINRPSETHHLPFTITRGGCSISVEIAGPDAGSTSFNFAPDIIRGMTGYIIQECAFDAAGIGGFVTNGLGNRLRFITVTVSGPQGSLKKPGDTDPEIAFRLGNYIGRDLPQLSQDLTWRNLFIRGLSMDRGSDRAWWGTNTSPTSQVTYECDAKLGSPAAVDCTHLEYEGLKPAGASDIVQIGPGSSKVINSNSCTLVISASNTLTTTWSALQTAFSTLVNLCVEDPVIPSSRGGRAFYGTQSFDASSITRVFGRNTKRQMQAAVGLITGLNALPPGLNMTVGSHADSELLACELMAAQQGKLVSSCGTA